MIILDQAQNTFKKMVNGEMYLIIRQDEGLKELDKIFPIVYKKKKKYLLALSQMI